jgi:hypothetical protein
MDMKSEAKKTDLRELLREVLATAREESAKQGGTQTETDPKQKPNQP